MQDLKLAVEASTEAEYRFNEFCNCNDNSQDSTTSCQAGLTPELVSGNYEMGVSYDEGDKAQESFDFLLDNSPYV